MGFIYFIRLFDKHIFYAMSKPVVPKLVRAVTQIKVAIMSYHPQCLASWKERNQYTCVLCCSHYFSVNLSLQKISERTQP